MRAVDVFVLDPSSRSVTAPGPVHGLQHLDGDENGDKSPDVAENAENAPGVIESDEILNAEGKPEDGIETEQAVNSWVGPTEKE